MAVVGVVQSRLRMGQQRALGAAGAGLTGMATERAGTYSYPDRRRARASHRWMRELLENEGFPTTVFRDVMVSSGAAAGAPRGWSTSIRWVRRIAVPLASRSTTDARGHSRAMREGGHVAAGGGILRADRDRRTGRARRLVRADGAAAAKRCRSRRTSQSRSCSAPC